MHDEEDAMTWRGQHDYQRRGLQMGKEMDLSGNGI